jgi:phosphatidyl-myo-inositol alpha-mannosyltransferase
MRIGIWCPDDLGRPGGVQAHALGLADDLRARGDAVTLFAPGTQPVDHEPPLLC